MDSRATGGAASEIAQSRRRAVARAAAALADGPGGTGSAAPSLREAGFLRPDDAARVADALRRGLEGGARAEALDRTIAAAAATPAPDQALVNLTRLGEALRPDSPGGALAGLSDASLAQAAAVGGTSQFLADLLARHPEHLAWLAGQELAEARTKPALASELAAASADPAYEGDRRLAALRAQRRELLRLALRRMLGYSDEMTMAGELSDLAAATLEWGLEALTPALVERFGPPIAEGMATPFAVIGMGKLGGHELNFSSDIDLLFVYGAEGRTKGRGDGSGIITNHQFFTRLAEGLIATLMEPTEEGYFYRVDVRLRPEGASGPLVRGLDAYEVYYSAQAHPWERLALLKARAVAGDARLGRRFEAITRPLIYDPLHRGQLVKKMRELKQGIDRMVASKEGGEREIKRGTGGIREIEFLVQTLQMLHGETRENLWAAGTLEAIEALTVAGYLPAAQARTMREDYILLRTLEHRLQMEQLRQTHTLPAEAEALDLIARRCGIEGERPGEALRERWQATAARVHAAFVEFFNPLEAGRPEDPAELAAEAVLGGEPEARVLPLLVPFGLGTAAALKSMRRLGGQGATHYLTVEGRRAYEAMLPELLRAAGDSPRPEAALIHFESFMNATGAAAGYFEILGGNPALLGLLLAAMGSGDTPARTLIAHPEFIDYLSDPGELTRGADRPGMRRRLEEWSPASAPEEVFCRGLARAKRYEHLMSALGKVSGLLEYEGAAARLCAMAELVVERAFARAARELRIDAAHGGFAVLAMGKLGGGEFNQFTDLDLVFAWEEGFAEGRSASETGHALAERLIALLTMQTAEGAAYAVDLRLRPEGTSAPLAPPVGRYLDYFRQRAQVWEWQSMMKLRTLAGDKEVGGRLVAGLREIIAERVRGVDLAREIKAMRARMEAARKLPRWVFCDFKAGYGGIVDLEFAAQFVQLRHLAEEPELMGLGPPAVLERGATRGWLEGAMAARMAEDYRWLRRLEDRVRLLFETERSWLPDGGEKLAALERASGRLLLGRAGDLKNEVGAVLQRNRKHFNHLLEGKG